MASSNGPTQLAAPVVTRPGQEFSSPFFDEVVGQFDAVKDRTGLGQETLERLRLPKKATIVTVPVRMDTGETRTYLGYRVQHSITSGPGKGGLRYHPDVFLGEIAGLATIMSWKCGLMNLPFGGAKGGVNCDPTALSLGELERVTRRFTMEVITAIGEFVDVMAPDLGTNHQVMAWIYDTYSIHVGHNVPQIVTGKSPALYGTLGRREATGRGVVYCVEEAALDIGVPLDGARIVLQGFGNVGSVAAEELARRGARIVAVGDVTGAVINDAGLNVDLLKQHVNETGGVAGFTEADALSDADLLTLECEVLIPAALERVITDKNADQLRCRILAEAANGPTTTPADTILKERSDIFIIPDILCNAGGVTVSYFEWVQGIQMFFWDEEEVSRRLKLLMTDAYARTRNFAKLEACDMRTAALVLGIKSIGEEKTERGMFP